MSMSSLNQLHATTSSSAEEVLERVNELVPVLRARAPETERLRRMHPDTLRDLTEAGVPHDKLADMDDINERFKETDVVLVVGANDVVNPAARTNPPSPIYGMPILNVFDAKNVIVLKRGRGEGFSGVENDLFVDSKTSMLFGDAKQSLLDLGVEIKNA